MDAPDAAKQIVRVTIFNQSYAVSTSIARRAGNLDSTRTAVLACLHLADRLRSSEQQLGSLRQSIEHKSRDFALLLDQAFDTADKSDPSLD